MMKMNNTLKGHTLCTCGTLALFLLVFFGGIGSVPLIAICGIFSASLSVANPVVGYRSADSFWKRLAFIGLEVINISILSFCVLLLFVDMKPVTFVQHNAELSLVSR